MKYKNSVLQIAMSGLLVALGIVFGMYAHFPLFGGTVYLVGIVVFLMPLLLKLPYAFISGALTVVLTDVLTGWGAFAWISFIAYGSAVITISLFNLIKLKILYMVGVIVAAIFTTTVYYFLELKTFGQSQAVKDVIATSIQFVIVVPIVFVLYFPVKIISKTVIV